MAHFAQLDENNIVLQVVSIENSEIVDEQNVEQESLGVAFCQTLFGSDTQWKQTSYNRNFRKNYAGIGFKYDSARDAFIAPQPFPSWVLNESDCSWRSPVDLPSDYDEVIYNWDEDNQAWVLQDNGEE